MRTYSRPIEHLDPADVVEGARPDPGGLSGGAIYATAQSNPTLERCTIVQTARFKPKGLLGLAYWVAVLPLHGIVFRGMIDGIRRASLAA